MDAAGHRASSRSDGRVLALDLGSVRTGVAISDPSRSVATPLEPVQRAASAAGMEQVAQLVAAHGAVCVVVGLPVGPSGETSQTARSRSFADRLRRILDVPVELHDERFTSVLADRTSDATGSTTSRDSLAACHLLQSWMDASRG